MPPNSRQRSLSPVIQRKQPDCRICKRDHPLRTCPKFIRMNTSDKIKAVKRFKYCQNCLAHSHLLPKCRSTERCRKCRQKHHTHLHYTEPVRRMRSTNTNQEVNVLQSTILRPTVIINVKLGDDWGNVRGILSPCNDTTKIAEFIAVRYHLPIERSGSRRICKLSFKPHFVDGPVFIINATVTKDLPQPLRPQDLDEKLAEPYQNLRLADPKFFESGDINIILGADVYPHLVKPNIHPQTLTAPMAQDTILGWMLIGKIRQ